MASLDTIDDESLGVSPTLARADLDVSTASSPGDEVALGTKLGRYVVLERLGAGGMGVVYAAWDPQLDRKLALKLLDAPPGAASERGQARLLREAQAMARLVHPNVVTIHDVGTVAGRVFIAMEFIEGETLRAHLAVDPRSSENILEVFVAAGRGLAAAHDAGLIHRDFKPDNVMIGRDGRVLVLDFGLARRGDDVEAGPASRRHVSTDGLVETHEDSLGSLTRTGVLVGTPAYMSPEQFRADRLDARTDQFSFCVAAWEALTGARPFAGENHAELMLAVFEGKRREFPRLNRGIPERAVRALERGLAVDPQERWSDMSSLLAEFAPPPPPRRSRGVLAGTIVLALTAGLGIGLFSSQRGSAVDDQVSCDGGRERLEGTWDEPRAQQLEGAFAATGEPWAKGASASLRTELDAWASDWSSMYEDACAAHHTRHEQSAELFDLRMRCLDQRARSLRSFVDLMTGDQLDPAELEQAVVAARALPRVDACGDPKGLRARLPLPDDPDLVERISELSVALDQREQLQNLGRAREALEGDEQLEAELKVVNYPPLWARYWSLRALDLLEVEGPVEALEAATEAVRAGRRAGDPDSALLSILVMTRVAVRSGDPDESERWLVLGEAIGEETEDLWHHYELIKARGMLAGERLDGEGALEAFARALAFARESFGDESYEVAVELANYGISAVRTRGSDPALADDGISSLRESIALTRSLYSDDHPITIRLEQSLISGLVRVGREAEALDEIDAVDRVAAPHYPRDHELRVALLDKRARALEGLGRCEEAFAELEGYELWTRESKADEGTHNHAITMLVSICGWSHPRALELIDQLSVSFTPDPGPPTSPRAAGVFSRPQPRTWSASASPASTSS